MEKSEMYRILRQRPPMVFVDDITEVRFKEYAKGEKFISENDFWAKGHFPQEPIFPGTFIIETMAQTAGFVYYTPTANINVLLTNIDNAKIIKPVYPGCKLVIEAYLSEEFGNFSKMKLTATVDNKIVAKAALTLYIKDENQSL